MATDKSSRTRKSGNSKTPIESQTPSDLVGIEGSDGTQVINLLTGGSLEPGSTTQVITSSSTSQ